MEGVAEEAGGTRGKSCATVGGYSYKRIEFHLAGKRYEGLKKSGDFWIETLNPESGRKRSVSGGGLDGPPPGKRVEGSELVESGGVDPERSLGFTIRKIIKIGAGLENLGNTCFLNSVLQCLTYTEPLAAYLQSGKHQNSCRIAGFCALCAIQKHVSRALQSTGRSLVPKDLVSNLRCISRNFRNARQEDAHEYMVNLLESMHKCCLPSGVPTESPIAYEKSLVHKIFGGRLRSQVECLQCSYRSDKFDPFLDLSLEILKADRLPVALHNFTAPELLDGGEKHYQCQRCKEKVKAKKRLTVHHAPYVLTIHLKRFHALEPGRKVDKKVLFPCSLDMKPFFSGSCEGDLKYSLYGVLVHYGHNTHSGHYVCFVRTSSGMWYFLNDNEVRQVSEKTVLEQKAYMLFYVRDQKHIAPRKSIDAAVKDNMKATTSSNAAPFQFNIISKESVGNVKVEQKSNAAGAEAPVNRKGAINSSTENLHKLEQNSRFSSPDSSMKKADAALKASSRALPPELGKKDLSSSNLNSGGVGRSSDISTGLVGTKKKDGIAVFSSCGSQSSPQLAEGTSLKINPMVREALPGEVCCGEATNRAAGEVTNCTVSKDLTDGLLDKGLLNTQSEPSSESNQGLDVPRVVTAINSNLDKAGDSDFVHEIVNAQSFIPSVSLCDKASEGDPPKKKFKKKIRKRHVKKLRLTARLFDASLHIRKKKNKNVKHHKLDAISLKREHKPDDSLFSSELVASEAKGMATLNGVMNTMKMEPSLCSKDPVVLRTSSVDATNDGTQHKDTRISSDPSSDKKLQKYDMSTSGANELDGSRTNYLDDCKLGRTHEGNMSIPTRALAETTVARWDGVGLPRASVDAEGPEYLSIGYVADEWDEEYDRGKRKKLRNSKREFSGLNPFQEIANKKAKFKQR